MLQGWRVQEEHEQGEAISSKQTRELLIFMFFYYDVLNAFILGKRGVRNGAGEEVWG